MGRPKGSKNKQTNDKEPEIVAEEIETEELLDSPPKNKKLIGYSPINGEEIWE
jgi:hypothetical protein